MAPGEVDTSFDCRTDAGGKDMDSHSATLRRYHQLLWSKPVPGGGVFDLSTDTPGVYLHHRSELGEFWLSSDTVVHTFSRWPQLRPIIDQIPKAETEAFVSLASTVGATIVFPGNQVDRKPTINQQRGIHPRVKDRFDLTLECIRRHYSGEPSPLAETLSRYSPFLGLFEDFAGYVDFFHLQDLVVDGSRAVKFLLPFDDFAGSPVPGDLDEYLSYRASTVDFVKGRNDRIAAEARHRSL